MKDEMGNYRDRVLTKAVDVGNAVFVVVARRRGLRKDKGKRMKDEMGNYRDRVLTKAVDVGNTVFVVLRRTTVIVFVSLVLPISPTTTAVLSRATSHDHDPSPTRYCDH